MRRKAKKVEYKDTNIFAFAPKYEYPLQVRGRWLQFHALSKGYIKILNYAVKFRQPETLLAVYLYGDIDEDSLRRYINKIGGENLYVFVWRGIDSLIAAFGEYKEMVKDLKNKGFARNGEITPIYFEERDKFYAVEPKYIDITNTVKNFHDNDAKIAAHDAATNEMAERIKIERYSNGAPIDPQAHYKWLFETAKKEYPCGVEADSDNDNSYKTIAISRLMKSIEDGNTDLPEKYGIKLDGRMGQLSTFDRRSNASAMIDFARDFAKREIENRGSVFLEAIIFELRKKPFGWYPQNNYYAYVLGYALRELCDIPNIACFDTIGTFDYSVSQALWFAETAAKNDFRRNYQLLLFINTSEAKRLTNVLYRLFNLSEIKNYHGTEKYLKSTLVRISIEVNTKITRYPYADVDLKLWELLNELDPICDKRYGEFADYFERNLDELKQKLSKNDTVQKQKLINKYGQKEADFIERFCARPKCYYQQYMKQGEFNEMAEKYHNSLHCRECGKSIGNLSQVCDDDPSKPSGKETIEFTLKEVIGLNKKMLNLEKDNMFCLNCLMEFLDITLGQDLKDRIEAWKAQDCTLFL